jgi:hypothetical protein
MLLHIVATLAEGVVAFFFVFRDVHFPSAPLPSPPPYSHSPHVVAIVNFPCNCFAKVFAVIQVQWWSF